MVDPAEVGRVCGLLDERGHLGGEGKRAAPLLLPSPRQMKPQYKGIVSTNVYPVPSGGGIPVGVHFTPTVNERRGPQARAPQRSAAERRVRTRHSGGSAAVLNRGHRGTRSVAGRAIEALSRIVCT